MQKPVRILIVEDKPEDADLAKYEIRSALPDCEFHVVETREDFLSALETFQPDVILSDYALPRFDGMKALKLALEYAPLTPLIIWTGSLREDAAVECMKAGANNYVLKDNLKRLGIALIRALKEKEILVARKQAELALESSEKRFRALVQHGLASIALLAADGTLVWESPAVVGTLHYAPDEHIGQNIFHELMHPDDLQWTQDLFARVVREPGSHHHGIFRLRHANGTWHWVEAIITNMLHEPTVNAIVANYRDVNEQKQAEIALQNSEKRFRALMENGLDDISLLAADGTLLWESPSVVRNLGYAPDEFVGRNIFDLIHPEDLEGTNQSFAELLKQPGGRQRGVFRLHHGDGTWRWVEAIATNLLNEPSVNAIVVNYRDITWLKQAEAALTEERNLLRTLIDNIPDRIYAMDMQGRKTLSNTADWKASGGKSKEEVIGRTDFDTYPPDLAEDFWRADRAVLDSGQAIVNYEEPGLDTEGNRVSILTTKIPLRDSQGNVIGLVGIGRDITERKQTEKALRDSEQSYRVLFENMPIAIWEEDFSQVTKHLDFLKQQGIIDFRAYFAMHPEAVLECARMIRIMNVNNAAVQMFEAQSKERLIVSTDQSLSQGEAEHLHEVFADIAEGKTSNSWEGADETLTGRPIEISLSWSVAQDDQADGCRVIVTTLDITERKQAEEALRQSQDRYRTVVETQTEFIVRWKADGIRTFANEAYCRYFGLTPEQALSSNFMSLIHEEDRQRVEEKIHRLVSGVSSLETETHRVIKPDGGFGWQEWTDQAIRDESGKLIEFQSVGRDITERRQAEIERQVLLEIMQGLANTKDLQELLKLVHHSIAKVIYAENFFLVLYQQNSGLFEEIYSVDQYDPPMSPSKLENSITSYVFRSGNPLLLTQTSFNELRSRGEVELVGTDSASWLGVPLRTSGRIIGVIAVQDYENPNRYTERDKEFLASIASQVALAIERKQGDIELQQKNDDLGLLNAINEAVVRGQDLDSIVELLARELNRIFSSQGNTINSTLYMLTPDKQSIRMQKYFFSSEVGRSIEKLIGFGIPMIEIPIKEGGHFHRAMTSRRSAIASGPTTIQSWVAEFTETRFLPPLARAAVRKFVPQICALLNINSVIVIPLISGEEIIGFWDVSSSGLFTTQDLKRIENIAGQLTAVIQRQQANEKIRRSEEFLQSVQNALSASLAILDETGTIVQVNSAWREFGEQNGLSHPNAGVGLNYLEICDSATGSNAEEAQQVAHSIRAILAGERSEARVEYSCHSPDENRWFTLHITRFEDGEHAWIVLAHEDITERQQAEETLHKSEALYRQAIEVAGAVPYYQSYYEQGESIKYEFIGEGIRQITGYGPEEFSASLWDSLVEEIHLVDALAEYSLEEAIQRVRTGKNHIWKCEHRLRDRTGKIHWVFEAAVELRNENGVSYGSIGTYQDITERKLAEEALRESEEHYRAIFEGVQDAIFVESLDGKILMVNETACEMFGYSREVFLTKTVADLVPEGYKILTAESITSSLSAEPREMANRRANGEVFPIEISGRLQVINGETVLLVVVRDISERKRAEKMLHESEERFSAAFEYASIGMALVAPDGRWLRVNWALSELVGYTEAELLQKTFQDITHPEDLESDLLHIHQLLTEEIHSYQMEKRYFHKSGQVIWALLSVSLVQDSEGKPLYFIAQIQDISERKRVEESLRAERKKAESYLEIAGVMMLALDRECTVTLINQKGCEILGYSADEIIGKNWINTFLPEAIREEVQDVFQKLISDDIQAPGYYENPILSKSGEQRLIAWHNTMLRDDQGWIISSLSSGEDITERKEAEDEVRRSSEKTSALLAASLALTNLDLETTLQTTGNSAKTLFTADGCRVFLMEPDGETLRCVLALQENTLAFSDLRVRMGEGVTGAVAVSGQAEIVNQMHKDSRSVQVPGTPENEPEAIMFAPLKERERTIGVISIRRAGTERPFEPADLELLKAFASMAASAVSNARLFEETQQRLAELHASEERFRQLADNIQEAFWMTDAENGREIYMSPAAETIWGRPIQSLMYEPNAFIHSVYSEDQPVVLDAVSREKNGEKMQLEYRIVRPDGSLRWIWDRAFPILDDSGRVKRIAGISADITERRESEMALLKSQSRYRELFDSSPISIWEEDYSLVKKRIEALLLNGVVDLKEYFFNHPEVITELASMVRITDVNKASLELYHIQQKDSLLRNLTEALGSENITHFQDEVLGLLSPLKRFTWEGTEYTFDGVQIEVSVTGSIPQGYEEDWSKVIVTVSDITESRQAEQQLRKLSRAVQQSGSTIVITDTAGTIEYVNPKFTEVTGYSHEEVVGQNPRILKSGATSDEEYRALWKTISSGGEWHGELLNKKKDGTLYWESVTISPILNDRKEITHYVGVTEDITERKQSEIETRRHIAELEALYENGLSVGRLLEPAEIGDRVIKTFARHLPWHHVTIRLRKEDSDDLELVAFSLPNLKEEEKADIEQAFNLLVNKVGQGLSGWVIQTGAPLRTGNVNSHPQYVDAHPGIQSGLYMPLKVGERVIGVISVESEVPDAFTEQDERLLATLANQTAIAFENARLYEAMQTELSERRRVENALRISETHYRELADSITDILFEMDHNLHYTHWNKASEKFSGIPAKDAIGKSIEELFGASEEQTRRMEIYRSVLTERQAKTFELEMLVKGQKRALELNAYPSARGVSVVAKDVTDRKRTETIMQKRFELMEYSAKHSLPELMQRAVDEVSELTGSTIGFFHFMEEDQNSLAMQTWSTSALQLFEVSTNEGAHLPVDRAGAWAEAVRQRRPLIQNDLESQLSVRSLPHGHIPIVREMVIPIIRNERMLAVMGIGNKTEPYTTHDLEIATRLADYAWDVTERKQMELALEIERNQLVQRVEERTADLSRANSNLARALRVKDEFLANMSHELRTPLNAILGLSESLAEQIAGPLNEKQQKYISTISESGHHLLSLINDILDLAKIDAGQITLDINKMDIHSVCQASLRMIKQLAQKKNQEVSLDIDNGLGLMWADERRLKQMIVNLLGNAVKFTPENGKLGLEVRGDQEANQIAITVWDTGIGIKDRDLARLFQPFVQLDSGLAREATGTGLGLALVAQMARLHGGSVSVESEPEKGSRFSIVLPWEPALAIDTASRMRITGKFRTIQFDEKDKPTILLVEDTKEVVMMIKDYLELTGFKVFTAEDGIDGLVQARRVKPDLILMDIQMPRMDGFETTRKLRSDPNFRYTPIIALTALAMPQDRERCLAAGMDEYISKPVNLKSLIKIIQSCLFE